MTITIDDMARAGCTTPRGIRFWEKEGLLGNVERSSGNRRQYGPEHLGRARIVAAAQFGGWSLDDCKKMVLGYDEEVKQALWLRIDQQIRVAQTLQDGLPDLPEPVVYDL